jgi:predicted restriction endonuclease
MRERFKYEPEQIDLSYFAYCIFPKFPEWIRREVRESQDYTCALCHEYDQHLEVHHVRPQCQHGRDTIDNAVGLCGPSTGNDCHAIVDTLALDYGVYYGDEQFKELDFSKLIGAHR